MTHDDRWRQHVLILIGNRRLDDAELKQLDELQEQEASVETAAEVFLDRQLSWVELERARLPNDDLVEVWMN